MSALPPQPAPSNRRMTHDVAAAAADGGGGGDDGNGNALSYPARLVQLVSLVFSMVTIIRLLCATLPDFSNKTTMPALPARTAAGITVMMVTMIISFLSEGD